jgi:hypothetical protein
MKPLDALKEVFPDWFSYHVPIALTIIAEKGPWRLEVTPFDPTRIKKGWRVELYFQAPQNSSIPEVVLYTAGKVLVFAAESEGIMLSLDAAAQVVSGATVPLAPFDVPKEEPPVDLEAQADRVNEALKKRPALRAKLVGRLLKDLIEQGDWKNAL